MVHLKLNVSDINI